MRLPEVQKRLREIAGEMKRLGAEAVWLSEQISRRKPVDRAPQRRCPVPKAERDRQIRALKRANPKMSQREIAERLDVNQGRVSEALRGHRK